MGACNAIDRVLASIGAGSPQKPSFTPCLDVQNGGVLLALPALQATGLLRHTNHFFKLPQGYYGIESIFTLLGFMALCRVKTVEDLRYLPPGEWGKMLGLDRIPEVKTLREKLAILASQGTEAEWNAKLCKEWMEASPEGAGVLYIDGHVRVYHGSQTKLPRHYVSRERLAQRATVDYWINALDGQPFFKINQAVDPGLVEVLKKEIVPYLKETIPNQPTAEELEADQALHRFTLVFDREGYSPDMFRDLKLERIACHSYHKFPGTDWSASEFTTHTLNLPHRVIPSIMLAERGTQLSNDMWVRECRRLSETQHQTAILSTNYKSAMVPIAAGMLCRWSQENFFKYMREHYNLDKLVDHQTAAINETTKVVNPTYRDLEGKIKKVAALQVRSRAKFGSLHLLGPIDEAGVKKFEEEKARVLEAITSQEVELLDLKAIRKATKRHIKFSEMPEEKRFRQLSTHSKHLVDTIKMIAYRAETAMVNIVREKMTREDDARAFVRSVYNATVDIIPVPETNELHVKVHHAANNMSDEAVRALCAELTETETTYPGTELRLVYSLISDSKKLL